MRKIGKKCGGERNLGDFQAICARAYIVLTPPHSLLHLSIYTSFFSPNFHTFSLTSPPIYLLLSSLPIFTPPHTSPPIYLLYFLPIYLSTSFFPPNFHTTLLTSLPIYLLLSSLPIFTLSHPLLRLSIYFFLSSQFFNCRVLI